MDEFLRHYGLWAVYFGMWLEGETVLVITGFLAHQHAFPLWAAYLVTVLGALSVDNLVYVLGHYSGRLAFTKKLKVDESGARTWAQRAGDSWLVFFVVRFVYGTRTPFIFYSGHRMKWLRFAAREVPAVCVWCGVWLFFGNLLSNVLLQIIGRMHEHHRLLIVLGLAVAGTLALAILAWRRSKREAGEVPVSESSEQLPEDDLSP